MAKFSVKDIKGVIPAVITPFDENENFDEGKMRHVIDTLIEKGVHGFYLCGSTGEGFLMTLEERKKVTEVVVDQVKGRVPVIVHIGAISTKLSIDLAKHAQSVGADAISSVPPFYWRFSEQRIFEYYSDIAAQCELPMIVYNVPLVGLFGFDFIKRLSTIPGVEGIKYTAYTHQDIYKCKDKISSDFMVYSGADEMAVSGIINEADGIIGSFYSMMPDVFVNIYNHVKAGEIDKAQRLQKIAVDIIEASLKYDYYAVIKLTMKWMGFDGGIVRAPFKNLTVEQEEELKVAFRKIKEEYNATDVDVLKVV